jgi:hypothetical protein
MNIECRIGISSSNLQILETIAVDAQYVGGASAGRSGYEISVGGFKKNKRFSGYGGCAVGTLTR